MYENEHFLCLFIFSAQCQMPVQDMCINLECPIGCGAELPRYDVAFDLRVKLSDHTGSLENIRLSGVAAERVIGCTVRKNHNSSLIYSLMYTIKIVVLVSFTK
jgi:hypothetical protein